MMRRRSTLYFIAVCTWCVLAVPTTTCADDPQPEFRYDPSKALSFQPGPGRKPGFSPNGKLRAAVDFKRIRILSVPGNEIKFEFPTPNRAMSPTFSPDQRKLAYADCTGNLACESILYVRELETNELATLGSCFGVTTRFAFSGDGKRLAALTAYGPIMAMVPRQKFRKPIAGEIAVFDLTTKNELMHMAYQVSGESKSELPSQIALDHNGKTILITAKSGLIKVIDVRTHTQQFSVDAIPNVPTTKK